MTVNDLNFVGRGDELATEHGKWWEVCMILTDGNNAWRIGVRRGKQTRIIDAENCIQWRKKTLERQTYRR